MFDRMQFHKYIYEGVVEPSYKNLPGKTPTVLVTSGKIEENTPHHGLSLRRVRALESSEKDMYIARRENKNLSHPRPRTFFKRM